MASPVFIVGTGRCGSTLLSNLLRLHPKICSISEFFCFVTDLGSLVEEAFPEGMVKAEHFWHILSASYAKQNMMMCKRITMDEVLYPYQSHSARFHPDSGVPALEQTTLPHLTPEYDALYDEVQAFALSLSAAPIGIQYQRLFDWLTDRFHCVLWVERSGGSLRLMKQLAEHFPAARFLHLVRDGRDCAISMSKHYGFRMVVIAFALTGMLSLDPFEEADRTAIADVTDEYYPFLPEHFDDIAFRQFSKPPSFYARYWSSELRNNLPFLAALPAGQVHTMDYEDFLCDPISACREMLSFIDPTLMDEDWLNAATALIQMPRSSWMQLPKQEIDLLERACTSGFQALASYGKKIEVEVPVQLSTKASSCSKRTSEFDKQSAL